MLTKKLVVSTYLQYMFIAVGALLLFTFVRQIGGVLLTFLLAGVLAYALNSLIRRLEALGFPRVVAVLGVFLGLTVMVILAALILIVPTVGQIQALVRDPAALVDGIAVLVERVRELPYAGERISSIDYRNVPPEVGELCKAFVKREGERLGLRITVGRGVVEARPPIHADKGTAIRRLVEEYGPEKALFIGDDTTDLDAFRTLEELREEGVLLETLRIGVKSNEGPPEIVSEADLVVGGVEGVGEVLRVLVSED